MPHRTSASTTKSSTRATWGSGFGFVMAAAGSAIGLGNLWRFPYIAGENGGGLFVLIYLVAIVFVGLPILLAEIVLGRATGSSAVRALQTVAGGTSPWANVGRLGVVAATMALSVYSVVAGWALYYTVLAASGQLGQLEADAVPALFGRVYSSASLNLVCSLTFLLVTTAVVLAGVRKGLERWARILMPVLVVMLLLLLAKATTLSDFGRAFQFVFGAHADKLSAAGVLEALGHACFTLGVGVGVIVAYGSYLPRKTNIVKAAVAITTLDTLIALLACLVIFPITFSAGLETAEGPGLVFVSLTIAFIQMPGGSVVATVFFALLFFAALTSSISMLEVPVAYLIDSRNWGRRNATVATAATVGLLTVPAALTGAVDLLGTGFAEQVGKNWFDLVLDTVSNWLMPIGGLGFALFVGWRLDKQRRNDPFPSDFLYPIYRGWVLVLRYAVPLAVIAVFLRAIGIL